MKNLVLAIAGVAIGAQAFAADDMSWKHAGNIRVRHTDTTNSLGQDKPPHSPQADTNVWEQRTTISLTGMKGENLTGHVSLLNAQAWGRDIAAGDTADYTTQAANKNNVNMQESYIWWKTNDMFSLRAGRGGFTVADGSVVSANADEQIPTTFDGILGSFDFGFMGFNVFGVKGAELGASTPSATQSALAYDREQNFYGFSADFKNLPDMIKMANIHLIKEIQDYGLVNPTTDNATSATANKDWLRWGITIGGDTMGLDYKATYANVSGKRKSLASGATATNEVTTMASMMDLGVGYTFTDLMNFRIGAVYHQDSGDNDDEAKTNNTYDGFHYDKKAYLPQTRIVSAMGNMSYFGARLSFNPMENTSVGLDYTAYNRTSDKAEVSNSVGHTAGAANKEKALGSEVSLLANHKYSDAFSIGFRYSMWTYGDYFKKVSATATTTTDVKRADTNQWQLTAALNF